MYVRAGCTENKGLQLHESSDGTSAFKDLLPRSRNCENNMSVFGKSGRCIHMSKVLTDDVLFHSRSFFRILTCTQSVCGLSPSCPASSQEAFEDVHALRMIWDCTKIRTPRSQPST